MYTKGVLLSEINDRRLLERLIGKEVYRQGQEEPLGKLYKIFISKKSKQPLKVFVLSKKGERLELPPERIRVESGRVYIVSEELETFLEGVERLEYISRELKLLRNEILELDEKVISGAISWEVFAEKRRALEERRILLKLEAFQLVEALRGYAEAYKLNLSEEEEKLLAKILDSLVYDLPVVSLEKLLRLFKD
uniref:PRC-barrel domain-containing protein n=1 Tax=Thermofilum pendens TaxID=2269 RepID=A0A7C4B953_THEPE